MTRVFQPHIITDDSAVGGHLIPGSLVVDGDVYFSRTGSTDGNRKAFTLSMWYRPLRDTAENWLFGSGNLTQEKDFNIQVKNFITLQSLVVVLPLIHSVIIHK